MNLAPQSLTRCHTAAVKNRTERYPRVNEPQGLGSGRRARRRLVNSACALSQLARYLAWPIPVSGLREARPRHNIGWDAHAAGCIRPGPHTISGMVGLAPWRTLGTRTLTPMRTAPAPLIARGGCPCP